MPQLITRQQALDRINTWIKPGECLVCRLVGDHHPYVLHRDEHSTVALSQYPRTWGQVMVILNTHKTVVAETTKEEWAVLTENTRRATVAIERLLKPLRCYVSSLGATQNLPHTCPHLHFNIIPVYNEADKPTTIFTWEHGLHDGTPEEWRSLFENLLQTWETTSL